MKGDLLLGIFVTLAVVLALWIGTKYVANPAGEYTSMEVAFEDATGIQEGTPVYLKGINIGYVSNVGFVQHDGKIYVDLKLQVRKDVLLPEKKRIYLIQIGLMGEKGVAIEEATAEKVLEVNGKRLIKASKVVDFTELMEKGKNLLQSLNKISSHIEDLVVSFDKGKIKGMIVNFEDTSANIKKFSEDLKNLNLAEAKERVVSKLEKVAQTLKETLENVSREVVILRSNLTKNISSVSQNLNVTLKTVRKELKVTLSSTRKSLNGALKSWQGAGNELRELLAKYNLKYSTEEVQHIKKGVEKMADFAAGFGESDSIFSLESFSGSENTWQVEGRFALGPVQFAAGYGEFLRFEDGYGFMTYNGFGVGQFADRFSGVFSRRFGKFRLRLFYSEDEDKKWMRGEFDVKAYKRWSVRVFYENEENMESKFGVGVVSDLSSYF